MFAKMFGGKGKIKKQPEAETEAAPSEQKMISHGT